MATKHCPKCKKFIDVKHFAKNPGKRDGLNGYCRVHQKEYQQDWYRRNKDKHKKQVAIRNKRMRLEMQRWVLEYLATHPCVDCGEDDPIMLEFDHVRGRKRDSVCGLIKRRISSLEPLKAEVAKCEVRCANCHRRRTVKKLKWFRGL